MNAGNEIERLRAENERLRGKVEMWKERAEVVASARLKCYDEAERLRAENEELQVDLLACEHNYRMALGEEEASSDGVKRLSADNERLRAENERLRAENERLRIDLRVTDDERDQSCIALAKAGNEIERLRAENERLRALLDPDNENVVKLPCVTLNRGEAGTVVRLLVVPVYEGESNDDALRELD